MIKQQMNRFDEDNDSCISKFIPRYEVTVTIGTYLECTQQQRDCLECVTINNALSKLEYPVS